MTNQDREEMLKMLKLAERLRIILLGRFGEDDEAINSAADLLERLARIPAPAVSAEPCGIVGELSGSAGGFTFAAFHAKDVPIGSKLYLHPDPKVAELEAENAALRRRFSWLEKLFDRRWNGVVGRGSRYFWPLGGSYRHTIQTLEGETLAEAIDAAIAKESSHD